MMMKKKKKKNKKKKKKKRKKKKKKRGAGSGLKCTERRIKKYEATEQKRNIFSKFSNLRD